MSVLAVMHCRHSAVTLLSAGNVIVRAAFFGKRCERQAMLNHARSPACAGCGVCEIGLVASCRCHLQKSVSLW